MPSAVSLVAEARARRPQELAPRERAVVTASAVCFGLAALAIAIWLPSQREPDSLLIGGLIVGYAFASRVRFEVAGNYIVPEQLVFFPMLLLAPLPAVPFMVAAG